MDKNTKEDNSLLTDRVLTVPSPVKRPRTHCIVTNYHSGKRMCDFLERPLCKTTDLASSKSIPYKNVLIVCPTEKEDKKVKKSFAKLQDTKSIIKPFTKVTASFTHSVDMLSSKGCVITAERHLVHQGKHQKLPFTKSDKLCSYLPVEAGQALVDSATSKDATSGTSSFPDCKWLGKSFEDKGPSFSENDKDGKQVKHGVTQMQAFSLISCDEEVICQSDFSCENVVHDAGNTWRYAEIEVSNQKRDKCAFTENVLFCKEEQKSNSYKACSHYTDCELNDSHPKKEHVGNFVRDLKSKEKLLQLHICKSENVVICDEETKGQVNENGISINSIPSDAHILVIMNFVELARNISAENVSLQNDDLCGVKGKQAACKTIVKAWNRMTDHTKEALRSARVTQEPAEEYNNTGLYIVIDPAIWSQSDRIGEEKHCNLASTAGVKLSPLIKVCEMEVPSPLYLDVRITQEVSDPNQIRHFFHQSITQQYTDEKEDLCQSYTEPKAGSITTSETHNMKDNQSSSPCHPTLLPAGDGRQESHSNVGFQLKEQDQFETFPKSFENVMTLEAELSKTKISKTGWTLMINAKEDIKECVSSEVRQKLKIKIDEHMTLEKVLKSEKQHLKQNELREEDTASTCNNGWIDGVISEFYNVAACVEDKLEERFEPSCCAYVFMMAETTLEKERKKVKDEQEEITTNEIKNPDVVLKSEENLRKQNKEKKKKKEDSVEMTHVKCVDKKIENNMSASNNKLNLYCQHRNETCMVENTNDILTLTSSPTRDAVAVPCQNNSSHLQNTNSPSTLNCSGIFSLVPSSCIHYNWVPEGDDTFGQIQLLPDDYCNNEAGLSNASVHTSLPGQLLKTPQQQLFYSMPKNKSKGYQKVEEEEREKEELHKQYHMEKRFYNSDTSFTNFPNFISATDVIALRWPEQQPNCECTGDSCRSILVNLKTQSYSSSGSTEIGSTSSDVNQYPEFEMKKLFNMVLKELHLFFDISSSDFANERKSLPTQCRDISEQLETFSSHCNKAVSSTDMGCCKNTSTDDADIDPSIEICGGNPVISCIQGKQKVPLDRSKCPEAYLYSADKHQEPLEVEQRKKTWSPSFRSLPLLEQLSHRSPEHPKRLVPLRTCTRPIRVGLSKKAKTKHLHRPHPYK